MINITQKGSEIKIQLEMEQQVFFTSDTHYHHANICSATSKWERANDYTRQFPSLDAMNDGLVNGINQTVGENDILVHLGDWSFGGFDKIREFRERLNVRNIILFLGNH